jgi:hypothetical protein
MGRPPAGAKINNHLMRRLFAEQFPRPRREIGAR